MTLNPFTARGRVIAAGRMLAGLDQAGLAVAAGLSPSTVSNVERGELNVRESTLDAIKQALTRMGVDLTQNGQTGLHSAGTSYGRAGDWSPRLRTTKRQVAATATTASPPANPSHNPTAPQPSQNAAA